MTKLAQLHPTMLLGVRAYENDSREIEHRFRWSSGLGRIVRAALDKRANTRAYRRAVDEYLAVLLCGFSDRSLPSVRDRVAVSSLVRRGEATGIDVGACSVQVVIFLTRKMIGRLSKHERHDLAQAFLHNDGRNRTYRGFNKMLQVLRHFNVSLPWFHI